MVDDPGARALSLLRLSGRCERTIRDTQGVSWCVRERRVGSESNSLIFENEMAVRRVRQYPENWRTLSDEALERLSRAR